jgi:hypothetical protein
MTTPQTHLKALEIVESHSSLQTFHESIMDEMSDLNPVFNGIRKADTDVVKRFKLALNQQIKRHYSKESEDQLTADDLRQIVRDTLKNRQWFSAAEEKTLLGYVGRDYAKAFPQLSN